MDMLIIILILVTGSILFMKSNRVKSSLAHKSAIPELVARLYNDYIRDLPDWIELRKMSNSLITDAVYLNMNKDTEMKQSAIKIILKGKSYIFYFTELPGVNTLIGSWYRRGSLDIFLNGKRILFLKMAKDKRNKNSQWKPAYIEGFVEGDWIKDFQELEKQIGSEDYKYYKRNKRGDKEIES